MAVLRALLLAAALATASGLGLHARDIDVRDVDDDNDRDIDEDVDHDADGINTTAGTVNALDPELINTAGETFHVTQPGNYLMIGMPETASLDDPAAARLLIEASFEKQTTLPCEDLMIRSLTIQGFIMGDGITSITIYIADDTPNATSAMGLDFVNTRSDGSSQVFQDVGPESFATYIPSCSITRPRGFIRLPTKNSFRQRTKIFTLECNFVANSDGVQLSNIVRVHFNTAWRGVSGGQPVYANDLSVSISDVGATPSGLLGTDDHTEAARAVAGCNKAQPINGPFQYAVDGVRRHGHAWHGKAPMPKLKPWQRRLQEQQQKQQERSA